MDTARARLPIVVALATLLVLCNGCCLLLPALTTAVYANEERETRREADKLTFVPPGTLITLKRKGQASEGVHYVGMTQQISDSTGAVVPSSRTFTFRNGWGDFTLPEGEIEWVQDRAPYHPVLIALGVGLAVDTYVTVTLGRFFGSAHFD